MNRALLVGINKYKIPGNDLQGCLNDVTNIVDILTKFYGFLPNNIKIVTDEKATKNEILKNLKWLITGVKKEDRLMFHYSGHGSQVVDTEKDEPDGLDEILCPYDLDWGSNIIKDDQIDHIISLIPNGAKIEVLLDSCHSGTGTRELAAINFLPDSLKMKYRYINPPIDISHKLDPDLKKVKIVKGKQIVNHSLYAGCMDNQTSADAFIKGKFNGAFTYYFCKHIRDCQGNITRSELIKRVRTSLRYDGFTQIPQLECSAEDMNKKLFS